MTDYPGVDLPFLLAEEDRLRLPRFDADDAWALGNLLVSMAREDRLPVTVSITHGQQVLFHVALMGSVLDQADWLRRKTAVVYRYAHSSYFVGRSYTDRGARFEDEPHIDHAQYAAHGGAFPINVDGSMLVGVAAVSGLPQDRDHALVVRAMEAYQELLS